MGECVRVSVCVKDHSEYWDTQGELAGHTHTPVTLLHDTDFLYDILEVRVHRDLFYSQ